MGSGASTNRDDLTLAEKKRVLTCVDKLIIDHNKAVIDIHNNKSREELFSDLFIVGGKELEHMKPFRLPNDAKIEVTKSNYVSKADQVPELLSISIFHRHGSRGPGISELKPWNDREHKIVSQWQDHELESITLNGNILLKSLGKWFTEKYIMSSSDNANTRPQNNLYPSLEKGHISKRERDLWKSKQQKMKEAGIKDLPGLGETKLMYDKISGMKKKGVWRSSSSNRAKVSGYDFTRAVMRVYNHQLQLKPAKFLLPPEPILFLDVEGEDRFDDHGADHYFRPWNVYKNEMNVLKESINSNLIWVTKANANKYFLSELFSRIGASKTVLDNAPKMLWCTSYILCLVDCEKYWTTDEEVVQMLGTRCALNDIILEMEIESKDIQIVDRPNDEENNSIMQKIRSLACWAWDQRFAYQPYIIELGGRITFEILQQTLDFESGSFNVFSGHDYTIMGILAVLGVLQDEGGLNKQLEFGSYVTFELWSAPPLPHFSEVDNNKSNTIHSKASFSSSLRSNSAFSDTDKDINAKFPQPKDDNKSERDDRILRVILNPCPFKPSDQEIVHKMRRENANARDIKEVEEFQYSWPVKEEEERVIATYTIGQVKELCANIYEAMDAKEKLSKGAVRGANFLHADSFTEFVEKTF